MTGPSLTADDGRMLRSILADLRYPARWWEILSAAERYGAGVSHRAELARLPTTLYPNLRAILEALSDIERGHGRAAAARRGT